MTKTILSLFDRTGNWSQPYRDAGYNVIQVDIQLGHDIMTFDHKAIGPVHGILAAPPCTDFSSSGARWWPAKDADGSTAYSVRLAERTLEIITDLQPEWYAIENPVGRIERLVPALKGQRNLVFQPCDYGDPYTKKTILWGRFNANLTRNPVEPHQGSKMHLLPPGPQRQNLRSATPPGFARAFFEANP